MDRSGDKLRPKSRGTDRDVLIGYTKHSWNCLSIATEQIINAIRNNTLKIVSDVSYLKERQVGSAAWILEEPISNQFQIAGKIRCLGDDELQ